MELTVRNVTAGALGLFMASLLAGMRLAEWLEIQVTGKNLIDEAEFECHLAVEE